MQSWQILRHSISMVVNNFGVAIRLATPLIASMILSLIFFGQEAVGGIDYSMSDPSYDPMSAVSAGFATLIQAIAGLWVAVAWHRYILLEETPQGILPPFHVGRVLAYFGWGLLLVVIIALIGGIIGGIGGLLASFGGLGSVIGVAVIIATVLFIFYFSARIYVILPSAAIGRTLSLSQAWNATNGYAGPIILAYFFFVLGAILSGVLVGAISMFAGLIGTFLMMALNLALIMIGMSFLTTIYGITVEQRELSS